MGARLRHYYPYLVANPGLAKLITTYVVAPLPASTAVDRLARANNFA